SSTISIDGSYPLLNPSVVCVCFFFFQAEDGIRDRNVTGVQTCALPISPPDSRNSTVSSRQPAHQLQRLGGGGKAVAVRHRVPCRSEERRVGKECRSRGSPYHRKEKDESDGEKEVYKDVYNVHAELDIYR